MVKIGLIKRTRSKSDRRVVNVVITSKGENALKPATVASLEAIRKILSPLSHEDRSILLSLLGTLKYRILEYLNPGMDLEEMKRNESRPVADVKRWLSEYALPSTPQAKRQGGKKGKTV
jgi:hypothetical protein